MEPAFARTTATEPELIAAARDGDEDAFARLVEPHRRELHAHCYRMLGSVHDAEDALQDALLRAWRGMPSFQGRSSYRTWLYRVATNACLDVIARRANRVLLIDYGPAADPHDGPGEPLAESLWIEPYPDAMVGLEDGYSRPEAATSSASRSSSPSWPRSSIFRPGSAPSSSSARCSASRRARSPRRSRRPSPR